MFVKFLATGIEVHFTHLPHIPRNGDLVHLPVEANTKVFTVVNVVWWLPTDESPSGVEIYLEEK